jgi:hypothetical protein
MEDLTMPSSHRLHGRRAYGRAADAAAWKPPSAVRFDSRPANDPLLRPTVIEEWRGLPAWAHVVGGGLVAALLGAVVGGALHI